MDVNAYVLLLVILITRADNRYRDLAAIVMALRSPAERAAVMHFPPFHSMGIYLQLYAPLGAVSPACIYPPKSFDDHTKPPVIPTSDNIIEHAKRLQATICLVVPTFLTRWFSEPKSLEWLASLSIVVS